MLVGRFFIFNQLKFLCSADFLTRVMYVNIHRMFLFIGSKRIKSAFLGTTQILFDFRFRNHTVVSTLEGLCDVCARVV